MGEVCTLPAKRIVPVWSHEQLEGEGPLRWRQCLRRENRDEAIVFYQAGLGTPRPQITDTGQRRSANHVCTVCISSSRCVFVPLRA